MILLDGREWESIIKLINSINHRKKIINLNLNKNLGLTIGSDFKVFDGTNFIVSRNDN